MLITYTQERHSISKSKKKAPVCACCSKQPCVTEPIYMSKKTVFACVPPGTDERFWWPQLVAMILPAGTDDGGGRKKPDSKTADV